MQSMCVVFAYFGPETVMPMTSILATVAALVMMFGKTIFRFTFGWVRLAGSRLRRRNATPPPHFSVGHRRTEEVQAGSAAYAREVSE